LAAGELEANVEAMAAGAAAGCGVAVVFGLEGDVGALVLESSCVEASAVACVTNFSDAAKPEPVEALRGALVLSTSDWDSLLVASPPRAAMNSPAACV
jgi:hypothetical protein